MTPNSIVQITPEFTSEVIESASKFSFCMHELLEVADGLYQKSCVSMRYQKQYNEVLALLLENSNSMAASVVELIASVTPALFLGTLFRGGIVTEITYKRRENSVEADYWYSLLMPDDKTVYFWQHEITEEESLEYSSRMKDEMLRSITHRILKRREDENLK